MTIEAGTRLGPYEIIAPIGAGGMGEVYKANDTRLDRTVAIKVLPEHLAESPERKARFEREAKAISQLNHPHICTLYEFDTHDGVDFIVMEYIEGETLAERLKKGALKLDRALEYGIQIADGLDTAHRAGIVHRDLKPANAMLTKSGVKLLDFGLAKVVESETGGDESDAPTRQQDLTQERAIIGTLQYMAPEQLEHRTVDARTDIFALGAVLYEMLTGRKAFEGTSQASLIGAILQTEPPSMATYGLDSPSLDHIVRTCLIKEPDERWHSAGDIARNLRWVQEGASAAQPATPVSSRSRNRERVGWALALLVAAVVASMAVWNLMKPGPKPVKHFSLTPPPGMFFSGGAAFSRDARMLAYSACEGACNISDKQAYVRAQDQLDAVAVPGTEGAFQVFFSPDAEWLGFTDDVGLSKAPLAGGPPVSLYPGAPRGASWATNDSVIFGTEDSGLLRIPATGDGEAEPLTTANDGEAHRWPHLLPGDRAALFTVWRGSLESSEVAVVSLDTGEQQSLVSGVSPIYSPSGHLVFARDASLWAMLFDSERLTVTGPPVLVVDGVETAFGNVDSPAALGADGSLIYEPARTEAGGRRLVWVDRKGNVEPLAVEPDSYYVFDISPDGRKAAIDVIRDNRDIWIYDLVRDTSTRLTSNLGADSYPIWTQDGARVIYGSRRGGGPRNLFWRDSLGTGDAERLTTSPRDQLPHDVTSDGRFLVFIEEDSDAGTDIGTVSLLGERETKLILSREFNETHPAVSPDGRWMAYGSDESGEYEIFVRPFPNVTDGRWQISSSGGNWPVWAPNGRELFYWSREGLVAVAIDTEPAFRPGNAQLLFEDVGLMRGFGRTYDVAPDGQRFLLVKQSDTVPAAPHLAVILNWTEELKRLVPAEH